METIPNQSFPDVSNFMSSTYMQDQNAEMEQNQNVEKIPTDSIRSAISAVSDRLTSVSSDIDNVIYMMGSKLDSVVSDSTATIQKMSSLLSDQRQERLNRESMIEEQTMLFGGRNEERSDGIIAKQLSDLDGFLDTLSLGVSKIDTTSNQDGFINTVSKMPKWVIGTLIGIGVVTAAQLGLPESNEEAGYSDTGVKLDPSTTGVDGSTLSKLIAGGESGGNYDIYNYKVREGKYGSKTGNLQEMTIKQILQEQSAGRMYAVGKYQMIPVTLREGVARLGLSGDEKFDSAMQERMFKEYLIGSKRPAVRDYITGKSDNIEAALTALSKEFSSVSTTYGSLKTAGGKGDKASISRESAAQALRAEREMYNKRKQQMLSSQQTEINDSFKGLAEKYDAQITSLYRSKEKNREVGGGENSYHLKGMAGDFVVPEQNRYLFMKEARAMGLDAIDEGDHIHLEPAVGSSWLGTKPQKTGEDLLSSTDTVKQNKINQTRNVVNIINTNKAVARNTSNQNNDLIPAINVRA